MVSKGSNMCPSRKRKLSNATNEIGKSSNVKVVVRVRPLNSMELIGNHTNVVRPMDDRVVVFDPHENYDASSFIPNARTRRRSNILEKRVKDLRFIFDRVFDERSNNEEIFNHTTKTIIDGVLNGYNCTVFAYGATGAGKTHTMLGNDKTPGVMFLTMMDLYKRIDEMKNEKTCEVAVSYLEVYNETIRDLLMPGKDLAIREDPQKGVCVNNLTLHQPRSAEELFGMLEFGNRNRSQHPTDANATSSRSHAVFQVFVRQKRTGSGLKADFQVAKMSLIDLAGSERATVTKNKGPRMREGANINKSLLALGNCINALAENKKNAHIPYRDSKLTRILKDSLGGNCKTVMIAAVSPSSLSYEDTYNTLKYADRAKNIKSSLVKNVVSVDLHLSQYPKLVKELQAEVCQLKERLNKFEMGEATPMKKRRLDESRKDEFEKLKSEIKSVYSQKGDIRKNILDTECLEKEMMEKLHRKKRNMEWMNILSYDDLKMNKVETKVRKCLSATKSRIRHLKERREKLNAQARENSEWLRRTQNDFKIIESLQCSIDMLSFLTVYETSCRNKIQADELMQEAKYYKKCIKNYELHRKREKRLIESLLKCVRKQHVVLTSSEMNTEEMDKEYENIVNMVEDNREVAWADQMTTLDNREASDGISWAIKNLRTPCRSPRSQRRGCSIDLTPRRLNIERTPSLTLSSTLPQRVESDVTPQSGLPGSSYTDRDENMSKTKSPCSVRLNLINELNRHDSGVECASKATIDSSSENKTMEMKRSKLKTRNAVNKSVGLPLREKTNNSNPGSYKNMQPEQNFNSSSGNENARGVRGNTLLKNSTSQRVKGKDMLPKRVVTHESSANQSRRLCSSRSGSSIGHAQDGKKLQHYKSHVNGVKRAFSTLNTRK